jgi:hypothetical protein
MGYLADNEEQAAIIRERIRSGKMTFKEACARIDGMAFHDTMEAVDRELEEHDQGGFNAADSGERDG